MIRAAPGAQLSEGRIRVDAAKALAKLREYQLTDRAAWVLEGIRGAVAAGATAITLDGDANDIWLAWEGPALGDDEITVLFDELVSPEATTDRHHVRLLAAAVNSALGMGPAYVDVYALRPEGAVRVRFTPDIFDGTDALRRLAADDVDRPPGRADGMVVHLRRRIGVELIRYLVGEPPELALARRACREIAVPLRVGDLTLHRSQLGSDVLRVKLGDLDGFLAIGPPAANMMLTVAERGVAVVEVPIELGLVRAERPLPLRAYVDAPRMPTNASRSDVRRTGHPIATAETRVREALPALVAALVEKVQAEPARGNPARIAAFQLLAAFSTGEGALRLWETPPVFAPLLELPLVMTATGTPVPLGSVEWDPIAHTGPTPYPEELAPWLASHMWVPPGDPAAILYPPDAIQHGILARGPMRRRARWARRGQKRKERFFNHTPCLPVLLGSGYYIRARLGARVARSGVDPVMFHDLTGEVALLRPDASAADELVILHLERVLERIDLSTTGLATTGLARSRPAEESRPLRCAAIVESPRIVPHRDYARAERGSSFDELERVVRAAVTCLGEALALALAGAPDARFPIVGARDPDLERQLVRAIIIGLDQAQEDIPPLLRDAEVWRTVQETFVSLTALRGEAVVGVGRGDTTDIVPPGRIVLARPVDRAALRSLAPRAHLVDYAARPNLAGVDAHQLAYRVARTTGVALAIEQRDRVVGAVGPSVATSSRVGISHTGVTLDEVPYLHALTPVDILIDDAAIVPTADWKHVDDDAGICSRSFEGWELALLRAIAATLAGDRPRELVGESFTLTDRPGKILCDALAAGRGPALLGPELGATLARAPLFELLGDPVRVDARSLAVRRAAVLEYVTPEAVLAHPLPEGVHLDPAPLVGTPGVAGLAAALADLTPRDVGHLLASRARQQRRQERLAVHRTKPVRELALPGLTVPLRAVFRGVVGVGSGATSILVRLEGRDLTHETRPGVPVEAIVEVDEQHVDDELVAVLPAAQNDLFASVRLAVPRLVQALVAAQPDRLAEPGPDRTFLATWLETTKPQGPLRDELAAARVWPAVQGGARASITDAVRAGELRVASWAGEWLGAVENEVSDPLDTPVLVVDEGELRSIYANLHPAALVDVTAAINKLQTRRRVKRGLAPTPTIPNASPVLTRALEALGPEGRALAPGQIALLDTRQGCVYLHAGGELRARVALNVVPPVALAIEAPELVPRGATLDRPGLAEDAAVTDALQEPVQELVHRLVASVLDATRVEDLSPAVRKQLARAAMTGLPSVAGAPLFEVLPADPMAPSPWVQWDKLVKQQARFGNVWYVTEPPADRVPLDPKRRVYVMAAEDAQLAYVMGLEMVRATRELALDAAARRNQARPRVTDLALQVPVIASVALDGDGLETPRGVVGILDPRRASERMLHELRRGHPFDPSADPCEWPTVSVVELANLTPDRTWASPVHDHVRDRLVARVRAASCRALTSYSPSIPSGVRSIAVNSLGHAGALWLDGPPLARLGIRVTALSRTFNFVPRMGLGLAGALLAHSTDGGDLRLETICLDAYRGLVRALAKEVPTDDVGLSHLAYALLTQRIGKAPSRVRFPCFSPAPLDPAGLQAFLEGTGPVSVIDAPDPGRTALVDDGSILSATLLEVIGERGQRGERVKRRARPVTTPPVVVRPHRLQPLVDALHRRLCAIGIRVPAWSVADDTGPLLRWERSGLVLAAEHPRVMAIAAHVLARSPEADSFLDLLAAHAATVMNAALTEITDGNERAAVAILASSA